MKTFHLNQFRIRITIAFLLLSIAPLLLLALTGFYYIKHNLSSTYLEQLELIADNKSSYIEAYFRGQQSGIVRLSKNPIIQQALDDYGNNYRQYGVDSAEYAETDRKLRQYLEFIQQQNGYYDLFLISATGDVVFSVLKERDFATNLLSGPNADSLLATVFWRGRKTGNIESSEIRYYAPSDKQAYFVTIPIPGHKGHPEGPLGSIAIQLNPEDLFSLTTNYNHLGKSGEIVLASVSNGTPTVIAPLRHTPGAAFQMTFDPQSANLPIIKALQGRSGIGEELDYRGKKVVAIWRHLPQSNLGIVVKIDKSEVFETVNIMQRWLSGVILLAALIMVMTTTWFSKNLSLPIIKLANSAKEFAQGKPVKNIPISRNDEIGYLTESFNYMRQSIETSRQTLLNVNRDLELRVNERTAELEKAIEQIKISQSGSIQAEKMAALGILAAGISHEINNPLMGLLVYIEYAEKNSTDVKVKAMLTKATTALQRIKAIVGKMQIYTHETTSEATEHVSVKQSIEDVIDLIDKDLTDRHITIEKDIPESLPSVQFNPGELFQCLLNILLNARDALTEAPEKKIRVVAYAKQGFVNINISDTGPGIADEAWLKIFDPFFTTKAVGKGTGLGLYVSRNLVNKNSGELTEESDGKGGALFRFQLKTN